MRAFAILILLMSFAFRAPAFAAADPPLPPTLAPMLSKVSPGVVNISVKGARKIENPLLQSPMFRQFFNVPDGPVLQRFQAVGSGVIYDAAKGYVITNNHVIEHASKIMVTLSNRKQVEARLVAADPKTDIAVLKIRPRNLTALPLGNSDDVHVGDFVVAIGDPFGVGQTATFGIVSALGRTGLGIEGYEDFIQTDASINPGNSGGALVDMNGRLIAINTAILSRSGGNVGIGFAIPIDLVKDIANQLMAHGKVSRGELGVIIQDVTPGLAKAMSLKDTAGALVADVLPDTPAAQAGLKAGDVIVSLNGHAVRDSAQFRNDIAKMQPGTRVHLSILRGGHEQSVQATLKPLSEQRQASTGAAAPKNKPQLGLMLSPVPENPAGQVQGAYVAGVVPGSTAAEAGIKQGDIITKVGDNRIQSAEQAAKILKSRTADKPVLLRIRRGKESIYVAVG